MAAVDIEFASSEPLTLGIEEEFVLVDASDGVSAAPRVAELLGGGGELVAVSSPGGWFKPEMLACSIEATTAANRSLRQLDVDLRALRAELVRRAGALDLQLAAIGMHPDLVATDDLVVATESHQQIAAFYRRVGMLGEQVTHGIHVHVGMPGLEEAVRVTDALASFVPTIIAATVHSPVVRGERSPWRSARCDVTRRMLWGGSTPRFAGLDEYAEVHRLHQLENAGRQRFLWEVAPVPSLGTVEVRCVDAHPDPAVALGVAALVQALAARVLDDGDVPPRPNESLEQHNRWSAMEFGPRARFLVEGGEAPVDVAQVVRAMVALARPHARELGNERWLDVFEPLLVDAPVERAIAAFDEGGVASVLAHARVRR